jgi:ABC-type branched-subunit amino acid transport system permease subunit
VALPEWLSGIERYSTTVYGALLLVVVLALPDGLVGVFRKGKVAFIARRGQGPAAA